MGHRAAWSAGHGEGSRTPGVKDPGAVSRHGVEADAVRRLTKRLAYDTAAVMIPTLFRDTGRYYLADDEASAFNATRFAEIHFNSGPSAARGVEVLIAPNASAKERVMALDYSRAIASTLGIPNRGVKVRNDLAVLRQYKSMASVLIEIAFISNEKDMKAYYAKEDELELAMFNVFRKSIGRRPMKKAPRLTWRRSRIKKYLKTV